MSEDGESGAYAFVWAPKASSKIIITRKWVKILRYLIGVDLGGTKIRVALARSGGEIVDVRSFPTEAGRGAAAVLRTLKSAVDELLAEGNGAWDNITGMGVGVAGFYDYKAELMINSPNLSGWESFLLKQNLEESFTFPIVIENDASAAAYGEYCFGAGQGQENILLLTLGTGIGGGLILGGELYRGSRGFAGEIGHIPILADGPLCGCGRHGCLEALASGTAIAREGRKLLAGNDPTLLRRMAPVDLLQAEHVFEAARLGDAASAKIIDNAAYFLGRALAIAVAILNPGIIVLSGGIAASGEQFFEQVRQHFHGSVLPLLAADLQIEAGRLGADSGIRGILQLLEEHLDSRG